MSDSIKEPRELQSIYERRFTAANARYRKQLWETLCASYFQSLVPRDGTVLDLGCGYGEFINSISCAKKHAMDLNPKAAEFLAPEVAFHHNDCTQTWPVPEKSLDVVFTSNFFEHLPDKRALKLTLLEAHRRLKPGGKLIALGPNIRFVGGAYWDFWDHFLCLTDRSLGEALENNGFRIVRSLPRFLPYTTVNQPQYPMLFVRAYLAIPLASWLLGKQFLVVAEKVPE
jgi:SAM-dependent methyltransferase